LGVLDRPGTAAGNLAGGPSASAFRDDELRRDVLHANAVKVLSPRLAAAFPQFKPGQLLVSLRNLDAVAVIDPDAGKVVWAARGPWHAQHDPTFLENGRLLLFDNLGSPGRSRVLEYDPRTQAFPWVYPADGGRGFVSPIRGMCQRLPNGNTLVVNSVGGEAIEVAADGEVVWSVSTAPVTLNRARRYAPDRLAFLKGGPRARP
jgi:outer membrane protein assembly factor BamB